jgi:hypothetical protein
MRAERRSRIQELIAKTGVLQPGQQLRSELHDEAGAGGAEVGCAAVPGPARSTCRE